MRTTTRGAMRWLLISVLLVLAFGGSVGCGADEEEAGSAASAEDRAATEEPVEITFALPLPPNLSLAGYVLTQERGIFEKHGLDVTFAPGTTGIEQVGLLDRGRAQFASFDIVGQCNVLNEQGIEMLGIYVYEPETFLQVFSLAKSGLGSNADLAGKRIGVTSLESGTVITAKAALGEVGLTEDDVKLVPVGTTAIAALLSGRVDVLSQFDMVSAAVESKGEAVHQFSIGAYEDVPGNTVFTTPEYAEQNPDIVRRFVAALQEGESWIAANPDEAAQEALDALPEQAQDEELALAQVQARIGYYDTLPGKPFGAFDIERYHSGLNEVAELGALEEPCDLRSLWTNEFVEQEGE